MRKLKLNPASDRMIKKYQDVLWEGQKWGDWEVVSADIKQYYNGAVYVLARCGDIERYIPYTILKNRVKLSKKHHTGIADYAKLSSKWATMIRRCYDTRADGYHRYGGRGIEVSDEFKDRRTYCKYISNLPKNTDQTQIDRIDNNGNYERGNLRWASPTENTNNRNISNLITYDGVEMSLRQFIKKYTTTSEPYGWYLYNVKGFTLDQMTKWKSNRKQPRK